MKKKLYSFLFILFCLNLGFISNVLTKNFIISSSKQKSQRSKTRLKEDIGFNIKDVLNRCVDLNKNIGQIQIELAAIQKQLFVKVEKLIDNKSPFKKAKTGELSETLRTIKEVKNSFEQQLSSIKSLKLKLNNNCCLKKN